MPGTIASKLISESVHRIEQMIEGILERNKIDALEAQLQLVEVKPYFRSLLADLKDTFSANSTKIEKIIKVQGGERIEIDQDLFFRAMSNLFKNSIEAINGNPNGNVKVEINCTESVCSIIIADNGPGIPLEILSKLGTQGVTHGKDKGSGLGLYQVKKTIELMSGELKIDSELGKGVQVTIRIPLSKKEE